VALTVKLTAFSFIGIFAQVAEKSDMNQVEAVQWGRSLGDRVDFIMALHPQADRDTVRHTLILLDEPPIERLRRSLRRGRAAAIFRS
jgi:hypothetical protein